MWHLPELNIAIRIVCIHGISHEGGIFSPQVYQDIFPLKVSNKKNIRIKYKTNIKSRLFLETSASLWAAQTELLEKDSPFYIRIFLIGLLWSFNNNLIIILLPFPIKCENGKGRKICPTAKIPWKKHTKLINRSKTNMSLFLYLTTK